MYYNDHEFNELNKLSMQSRTFHNDNELNEFAVENNSYNSNKISSCEQLNNSYNSCNSW